MAGADQSSPSSLNRSDMNKIILGLGDRTLSYKRREGGRRVGVPATPPACLVPTGSSSPYLSAPTVQPWPTPVAWLGVLGAAFMPSPRGGPCPILHTGLPGRRPPQRRRGPGSGVLDPHRVCVCFMVLGEAAGGWPSQATSTPSLTFSGRSPSCSVPAWSSPSLILAPGLTPCPFLHSCPHLSLVSSCNYS